MNLQLWWDDNCGEMIIVRVIREELASVSLRYRGNHMHCRGIKPGALRPETGEKPPDLWRNLQVTTYCDYHILE